MKWLSFSIPDDELFPTSAVIMEKLDDVLHVEKLTNQKNKGMIGSTRWLEMELEPGVSMKTFYWLEVLQPVYRANKEW